jgi:cytosine/adenosine deaminase-related metal-dependent hydrolase
MDKYISQILTHYPDWLTWEAESKPHAFKHGVVYIFHWHSCDVVKVGFTRRTPEFRAKDLKCKAKTKLKLRDAPVLVHQFESTLYQEQCIHALLKEKVSPAVSWDGAPMNEWYLGLSAVFKAFTEALGQT